MGSALSRRPAEDLSREIGSIAALDNPVRRGLYLHVCAQTVPVGRDAAAAALGLTRALATFHLEKLLAEGLLEASYQRLSGRSGPGAGRTAKLYRRSPRRLALALPARNYELLARLAAVALRGESAGGSASLNAAAAEYGRQLGRSARKQAGSSTTSHGLVGAVTEALTAEGFDPFFDEGGAVRLRNCPFHDLARESSELVCRMNLALMKGVGDGARLKALEPVLEPKEGMCCVAFRPTSRKGSPAKSRPTSAVRRPPHRRVR